MNITRIDHLHKEVQDFELDSQSALILFLTKNDHRCYLIKNDNVKVPIPNLFSDDLIMNIKFVGGSNIFNMIFQDHPNWKNKIARWVEVSRSATAIRYVAREKTIKVPRDLKTHELFCELNSNQVKATRKKVLIVDDSRTIQHLLTKIIEKSIYLEVMGCANNPTEAKILIEKEKPDLITLDIHMPQMNGVEFLKKYIAPLSIPTVMITSVAKDAGPLVIDALASGAVGYIQKPTATDLTTVQKEILDNLESSASTQILSTNKNSVLTQKFRSTEALIAIGTSTGGPQALQIVLSSLPEKIPPIVIVQHIPAVFSKALANHLNAVCKFKVVEAELDMILEPNTVYIAPGAKQMKLRKFGNIIKIIINDDDPVERFRPSVDYLFNSISALDIKNKAIVACILTGMGHDGAKGLLSLYQQGAETIAQDKESSVVYGMPQAAFKLGAVTHQESIENIAERIVLSCNKLTSKIMV